LNCIRSLRESMIATQTEWITGKCKLKNNMIQEIIDLHYNSHTFIMICVNLIFPIGLSQYGIVYQIMSLLLLP